MIELLTTYNIIIGVSVVLNLILLIGAFEKDDEVGATFQELKKLIEELNNEI